MESYQSYHFYVRELRKCSYYKQRYRSFEKSDRRYEYYRQKFVHHRKMALRLYFNLKEIVTYSELLNLKDIEWLTEGQPDSSSFRHQNF